MAFLHIVKTHCVSYDIWTSELIIRIEHETEITFLKDPERRRQTIAPQLIYF